MNIKEEKRRFFTGKLSNFISKTERNFEKKNLRAYLKGHERFKFGRNKVTGEDNWFPVSVAWK